MAKNTPCLERVLKNSNFVILSRYAGEESASWQREQILRYAQDDSTRGFSNSPLIGKLNLNKSVAAKYVEILKREYPDARCSLEYETPLQLAVATILSAQSTDERVNMTTPALFKKYRSVGDFAQAKQSELEDAIKTIGLYRAKAKNIIAFAKKLRDDFGGELPESIEELQTLPGVGRKTANVIQGVLHGDGKAEGIAVDTHVTRLSFRLGLTKHTDPKKIERDLQKWVDRGEWVTFSHLLILHGRAVCNARKPRCGECVLGEVCPKRGVR